MDNFLEVWCFLFIATGLLGWLRYLGSSHSTDSVFGQILKLRPSGTCGFGMRCHPTGTAGVKLIIVYLIFVFHLTKLNIFAGPSGHAICWQARAPVYSCRPFVPSPASWKRDSNIVQGLKLRPTGTSGVGITCHPTGAAGVKIVIVYIFFLFSFYILPMRPIFNYQLTPIHQVT